MDVYADFENVTMNPEVLQLESNASPRYPEQYTQQALKIILPTIGVHAQF